MVQILTQMQQLTERPHRQPSSADTCVPLPQQHFNGSNPSIARNHWTAFEKPVAFQTRQGIINIFNEFKIYSH